MINIENLTKTYENKEVLNIDQLSIKKEKGLAWWAITVPEKQPFLI